MKLDGIKNALEGAYKLTVRRADGTVRTETEWFPNLITNAGFYYLLLGQPTITNAKQIRAVAGGGTTPPDESDTRLAAYLGPVGSRLSYDNQSSANFDTAPYYIEQEWVFRSAQSAVVGNVTEVGVVNATSPSNSQDVLSRALVLDPNGNPTAVTVLEGEYLDVTWRLRYYAAPSSGSAVLQIDGVPTTYDYDIYPAGMGSTASNAGWRRASTSGTSVGDLHAVFTSSANTTASMRHSGLGPDELPPPNVSDPVTSWGTSSGNQSIEKGPLAMGQKYRDFSFSIGLTQMNTVSGIRQFVLDFDMSKFLVVLDKPIPKTDTKVLRFDTRISFENVSYAA